MDGSRPPVSGEPTERLDARADGVGTLSAAVVIPTYNRPDRLQSCLTHLKSQTLRPDRVVVADSSSDDRTARLVQGMPEVSYVRNPLGRGHTAESRAIGSSLCREDIIAFLDDDAEPREDWLEHVVAGFRDETVGGVGGSALNGVEGEREQGLGAVGLLLPDGRFTGNFAADTGRDLEVDHLLGANMAYRREAIERIGGIHGGYPGTCMREETDIALRVRRAGFRLVYTPSAVVDHRPGTYAKGKRFDKRYVYFANRNSLVLFGRIYGLSATITRRFLYTQLREVGGHSRAGVRALVRNPGASRSRRVRGFLGRAASAGAVLAGIVVGIPASVHWRRIDRKTQRERNAAPGRQGD
jgi:GT2 family glycosyltransferase